MSAHFYNFSWPSLYSPGKEVGFVGPPVRPGGYYLSDSDDIFKFTLYWTLVFHIPFNLIAGTYAFFNFLFPPARTGRESIVLASPHGHGHGRSSSQSQSHPPAHAHAHSRTQSQSHPQAQRRQTEPPPPHHAQTPSPQTDDAQPPPPTPDWPKPRQNAVRSRWTFALLVLLAFLFLGLLSAVVGAAVLACLILVVYRAGGFSVSTWIPFIWAVIQSLVALLGIWPSVIDII